MSVLGTVDPLESELWPQRDARDPLGIFGWRVSQASDATGGSSKILVQIPEDRRHAFVYKIYDMVIAQTSGTFALIAGKMRILTNWPNIDRDPGIQAYGGLWVGTLAGDANFTAPGTGPNDIQAFLNNSRDILLYDPSTRTGPMTIAEQEVNNVDTEVFSFEGYGYYWDRAVMSTPGGPRNPGTA